MSYIIKNCPVFNNKHQICNKKSKVVSCKDIIDCLLKRIVEKCREQNLKYDTTACQILELLEIEEVDE